MRVSLYLAQGHLALFLTARSVAYCEHTAEPGRGEWEEWLSLCRTSIPIFDLARTGQRQSRTFDLIFREPAMRSAPHFEDQAGSLANRGEVRGPPLLVERAALGADVSSEEIVCRQLDIAPIARTRGAALGLPERRRVGRRHFRPASR